MNNRVKIITILFLLLNCNLLFSQVEENDSIPLTEQYILFEGDTLLIELEDVVLLKKIKFKTSYEQRYYFWFRKKVLKAYPFAESRDIIQGDSGTLFDPKAVEIFFSISETRWTEIEGGVLNSNFRSLVNQIRSQS